MEVQEPTPRVFKKPFATVLDSLKTLDRVDATSAGYSPVTVRWLTPQNVFINIGLVEKDKDSCELVKNNNSYNVTDAQLAEAYETIARHVDG